MARHPEIVRLLTWNLFHGRDFPPDPALFTRRSRLFRVTETNATHAQVNRPLRREFEQVLGRLEWDVALLQEAPPRWLEPLCRALGCRGELSLTSRNRPAWPRAVLATLNPDLIASNEGGSNQLLVRRPWSVAERREHELARRPERRTMLWVRLEAGDRELAVANVHGTTGHGPEAVEQILDGAARAVEWAGAAPLVFGGDLNLRPERTPAAFEALRELGLSGPTESGAIDHLLARGTEVVEPPRALPPEEREVPGPRGRVLRISDHAPVVGRVRATARRGMK